MNEHLSPELSSFAQCVQEFLKTHPASELAREFEVTPPTVARWASGQNEPVDRVKDLVVGWIAQRLFADRVTAFAARYGTHALAARFGVTYDTVRRWATGRSGPSRYVRDSILEWMTSREQSGKKNTTVFMERRGDGWRQVPIPGTPTLPAAIPEGSYLPLHVRLVQKSAAEPLPTEHWYLQFAGDDGTATAWAPIESQTFLEVVLRSIFVSGNYLYGASFQDVHGALAPDRASLPQDMTERERVLLRTDGPWERYARLCWVFLD